VAVARSADVEADIRTLKGKYGTAYDSFRGLTEEVIAACETKSI
jgi:chromosome partitioning protein